MATTSQGYKINKHPIAQSFFVDEVSGIYVTKIDLFFATKDADFPVSVQLRPMDNGYPSSAEIIPGSQKVVTGSSVNVSTDATAATTFTFDEPIYLKGLTDYAIVVTADSKDYEIYVAQTNEFLIGSTEKRVDRQPVLGSLFYSQNSVTFTAAQNQDLTFKLYKAKFTATTGQIVLHNADLPSKLLVPNPIDTVNSSSTVKVNQYNHGLNVGEDVIISGVDSGGFAGIDESHLNGTRTVTAIDWTGYTFTAGATANQTTTGGGSNVTSSKNIPYSLIYPNIQMLIPNNTAVNSSIKATSGKSYAGTETAFQKDATFSGILMNQNNISSKTHLVVNSVSEAAELGSGVKSLDVAINMGTSDSNVTPMIDLQRVSATLVNYIIDRPAAAATSGFNTQLDFTDETSASGGSSASKHITTPVELEQDAVGLKIILSANRPSASDFQVYYRTAGGDQLLSQENFVLLNEETSNPSDENLNIFREYRYLAGGLGGDLPAFTQFQLKIVLRSTNAARVPCIRDLRTIAMSV